MTPSSPTPSPFASAWRNLRRLVLGALLLALPGTALANTFVTELRNALARGASGEAVTKLVLHKPASEDITITASDFTSWDLHLDGRIPVGVELYKGQGREKHDIWINLGTAIYWRMEVEKVGGAWHYDFHFFF